MKIRHFIPDAIALVGLALLSTPVMAHPMHGAGAGLTAGLAHPFMGLDHLLAMVAVGLWAMQSGKRIWLPPLVFVSVMALGSLLGMSMVFIPAAALETGLALSVLVLGLCVARGLPPTTLLLALLVASFALLHGIAHGAEMPAAAGLGYGIGFLAATTGLHALGMGLAFVLRHRLERVRALGGATAVSGALMLLG